MTATKIEWTDRVWNPVSGCTKVSAGCKHCYAEVMAKRTFGRLYRPVLSDGSGRTIDVIPTSYHESWLADGLAHPRRFTDVQCHPDRLDAPLRWRKPSMVFVNSMSDLFHEAVPDEFIDQVFAVMAMTPRHTYQLLTKRADRMRAYLNDQGRRSAVAREIRRVGDRPGWSNLARQEAGRQSASELRGSAWPLPNVWLGVSVEDQPTADARIPLLLQTPAAVRWVSYEPAIAGVDFGRYMYEGIVPRPPIDWIVCGGESGPKARPCDVAWIRSVVQQCKAAGVACFVKQLGAASIARDADSVRDDVWRAMEADDIDAAESFPMCVRYTDRKGGDPAEWPEDLRVREMPEVRS